MMAKTASVVDARRLIRADLCLRDSDNGDSVLVEMSLPWGDGKDKSAIANAEVSVRAEYISDDNTILSKDELHKSRQVEMNYLPIFCSYLPAQSSGHKSKLNAIYQLTIVNLRPFHSQEA